MISESRNWPNGWPGLEPFGFWCVVPAAGGDDQSTLPGSNYDQAVKGSDAAGRLSRQSGQHERDRVPVAGHLAGNFLLHFLR